MTIKIEKNVYDAMLAAAREGAPLEVCGLLGGREQYITEFYQLTNADGSADHFSMLPEEQFAAIRDMRSKNLRMLAIWHSHPETPARMSPEDLRLAFTPDAVYIVLSLENASSPDLRAFRVDDDDDDRTPLEIPTEIVTRTISQ